MGLAELWLWYGECITHCHCISHLVTSLPPHQTPSLTFQTISRHTIISPYITRFISHQHLSQYTIPLCNTIFQIATTSATFHMTDVPHNATFHVLHAASVSDHIYWPVSYAPHYKTLFHISVASFHHTWLWSHPIPHRTSEHPPHSTSPAPLVTFCITPPPLTPRIARRVAAHTVPHFTCYCRDTGGKRTRQWWSDAYVLGCQLT